MPDQIKQYLDTVSEDCLNVIWGSGCNYYITIVVSIL